MLNTFKKTAISAMVGLGILATIPASAQAGGIHITGGGGNAHVGIFLGTGGYTNWRPHRPRFRACTTGRALHKAQRMGVRHARVRAANRHVIKVKGRMHRRHVSIVFARAPGCPVIRY